MCRIFACRSFFLSFSKVQQSSTFCKTSQGSIVFNRMKLLVKPNVTGIDMCRVYFYYCLIKCPDLGMIEDVLENIVEVRFDYCVDINMCVAFFSPEDNKYYWEFSECSVLYFDFYIDHLNADGNNCMTIDDTDNALPVYENIRWFPNEMSRDVYDPDEQCERVNGVGSFLRRVS